MIGAADFELKPPAFYWEDDDNLRARLFYIMAETPRDEKIVLSAAAPLLDDLAAQYQIKRRKFYNDGRAAW